MQPWGPVHDFKFGYNTLYFGAAAIRPDNVLTGFLPYFIDDSLHLEDNFTLPDPLIDLNAHEILLAENGTSLIVQDRAKNPSVVQNGVEAMEDRFFEISRSSGEVLFEWQSLHHIPLSESLVQSIPGMLPKFRDDLTHINSIDKMPSGDYLVSARHTDTIYLISKEDGSIMWRLGGLMSSFELDSFNFSAQHDARYLGLDAKNRTLLSFLDNASMSARISTSSVSSGLIVALDFRKMTASVVKRFPKPDGTTSGARGNVQVLPNGNVFVCWSRRGYFSEFTADGNLVSEAWLEERHLHTYRAFKYDTDILSGIQASEDPNMVAAIQSMANNTSEPLQWNITTHASWNGGFALKHWRLMGCTTFSNKAQACNANWVKLLETAKTGFETTMTVVVSQRPQAVRVQALDTNWRLQRSGNIVELPSIQLGSESAEKDYQSSSTSADDHNDTYGLSKSRREPRGQDFLYILVVLLAIMIVLLELIRCR